MSVKLILVVAITMGATSCAEYTLVRGCHDDSDCPDDEVCFIDGCGDPGVGLAVEVSPSTSSGAATQDFALSTVTGTQDLALNSASVLLGDIRRPPQANQAPAPYTARVSFRVDGRSAVLPGVTRHYQTSLSSAVGIYSLPLSGGIYTMVVEPEDPSVPPFVRQNVLLDPGELERVDVQFPAVGDVLKVQGTVLADSAPVTNAVLEVQALDPLSRLPVSQKSPVSGSGEFAIFVAPSVHASGGFLVQVGPRDSTALVPKKTFFVPDSSTQLDALQLGGFGPPTVVAGTVLGPDGSPIGDATVYVDGQTASGATFSSARVHTDANGGFQLPTLPALLGSSLSLIAVPPPNSAAATVKQPLASSGDAPALSCPPRLSAQGRLLRSEQTAAIGVIVTAEAVGGSTAGAPLPPGASALTNPNGDFVLRLEPGRYRLDFEPADLPRMSRFVTLSDETSARLGELTLSKGKRVTGTVTLGGSATPRAAPLALVRFFRIGTENGDPSTVLLAETYTDSNGRYSVLLPTR